MSVNFRITSFRGDHNVMIDDERTAEFVFNRLRGIDSETAVGLAEIPDKLLELDQFQSGEEPSTSGSMLAVDKETMKRIDRFDPELQTILFFSPVVGG